MKLYVMKIVTSMQADEKKFLQNGPGQSTGTKFLENFLASGDIIVEKGRWQTCLLKNLAHDSGESIHQIVFHIEPSRAKRPSCYRAALKTQTTAKQPTTARPMRVLVMNCQKSILVSVIFHKLENANVVVWGRNHVEFVQEELHSLQIPSLSAKELVLGHTR